MCGRSPCVRSHHGTDHHRTPLWRRTRQCPEGHSTVLCRDSTTTWSTSAGAFKAPNPPPSSSSPRDVITVRHTEALPARAAPIVCDVVGALLAAGAEDVSGAGVDCRRGHRLPSARPPLGVASPPLGAAQGSGWEPTEGIWRDARDGDGAAAYRGAGREAGGRTGAESGLRPGAERSGAGGPAAQQRAGSAPGAPRASSARRCTAACERLSLGSALPLAGRAALRGPAGRSVLKSREENFSILGKQRPISKLPFQDTPPVQEGRGRAEVVALAAALYEHRSPQSSVQGMACLLECSEAGCAGLSAALTLRRWGISGLVSLLGRADVA